MSRKIVPALIALCMIGCVPLSAWAGPRPLSDDELDVIYAQGIFVNLDVHIAFPGVSNFSLPSTGLSLPDKIGANLGGIGVLDTAGPSAGGSGAGATGGSNSAINSPAANGRGAGNLLPAGLNFVGPGPNGLTISASHAAISMSINVLVANNSTIGGNVVQNSTSFPTNLLFSIGGFSP
jgi:hypothetical protein